MCVKFQIYIYTMRVTDNAFSGICKYAHLFDDSGLDFYCLVQDVSMCVRERELGIVRIFVCLDPDIEMMKERFAKLLLGEDMSGGGKGVSSALALSNAITNLAGTFGSRENLVWTPIF